MVNIFISAVHNENNYNYYVLKIILMFPLLVRAVALLNATNAFHQDGVKILIKLIFMAIIYNRMVDFRLFVFNFSFQRCFAQNHVVWIANIVTNVIFE